MAKANDNEGLRITSADVAGRREAEVLARTDASRALRIARAIRHPWYRCQALASIAEAMAASAGRDDVLSEAVDAAFEQDEPNRVACAASWPLRAMVRSAHAQTRRVVERLLDAIAREPHGLRRLDGLAAIIGPLLAVPELRAKAWRPFVQAAEASRGWRTERIVAWMSVALAEHDREAALGLLAGRSDNRFVAKARSAIAAMRTAHSS